jgi:hypothetical protein
MIGMEMRNEHAPQIRQADGLDQLPLCALAAVEQDVLPTSANQDRGQATASARDRAAGAREEKR